MKPFITFITFLTLFTTAVFGQQYNSMSGFIHTPSAEMNKAGDARVGAHFINKELMPDKFLCPDDDGVQQKYNSFSYYLSITPFRWVEVGFCCVSFKYNNSERKGYKAKDRHFTLKLNPLYEGKYYPSICVGMDDFLSSNLNPEQQQGNFGNYWIAALKHFTFSGHEIAANVGYRYYTKSWNKKYQGINAALTYRPPFGPKTSKVISPRAVVEYDGTHLNAGVDAMFFRHFLLQASLTNGKYFSGGLAFQINLF